MEYSNEISVSNNVNTLFGLFGKNDQDFRKFIKLIKENGFLNLLKFANRGTKFFIREVQESNGIPYYIPKFFIKLEILFYIAFIKTSFKRKNNAIMYLISLNDNLMSKISYYSNRLKNMEYSSNEFNAIYDDYYDQETNKLKKKINKMRKKQILLQMRLKICKKIQNDEKYLRYSNTDLINLLNCENNYKSGYPYNI